MSVTGPIGGEPDQRPTGHGTPVTAANPGTESDQVDGRCGDQVADQVARDGDGDPNGDGDGDQIARHGADQVVRFSAGRPLIGTLDGGVSRRLVRRCRTSASILLVVGAAFLLVVAVAPWTVISALLTLSAGAVLMGSLLVIRRAALWSTVTGSSVPDDGSEPSGRPPFLATVGPPRPMSPGLVGAPIKRRLVSAVVPIYVSNGTTPGGGALVVHARADAVALIEGDQVSIWPAGSGGLTSLSTDASIGLTVAPPVRGRFVLSRAADGAVFLATTRLTDTW